LNRKLAIEPKSQLLYAILAGFKSKFEDFSKRVAVALIISMQNLTFSIQTLTEKLMCLNKMCFNAVVCAEEPLSVRLSLLAGIVPASKIGNNTKEGVIFGRCARRIGKHG
jgi:hypothetical protein